MSIVRHSSDRIVRERDIFDTEHTNRLFRRLAFGWGVLTPGRIKSPASDCILSTLAAHLRHEPGRNRETVFPEQPECIHFAGEIRRSTAIGSGIRIGYVLGDLPGMVDYDPYAPFQESHESIADNLHRRGVVLVRRVEFSKYVKYDHRWVYFRDGAFKAGVSLGTEDIDGKLKSVGVRHVEWATEINFRLTESKETLTPDHLRGVELHVKCTLCRATWTTKYVPTLCECACNIER